MLNKPNGEREYQFASCSPQQQTLILINCFSDIYHLQNVLYMHYTFHTILLSFTILPHITIYINNIQLFPLLILRGVQIYWNAFSLQKTTVLSSHIQSLIMSIEHLKPLTVCL